MRRNTHNSTLTLIFLSLTLIFTACGAPSTTTPPPTTLSPTAGMPIVITMTNAPDENNADERARFQQLVAAFQRVRPDVTIVAHEGGWDKAAFSAKLAANTLEDAYLVPVTEPPDLIARGYAADITALLQDWEYSASFNPDVLRLVQDAQGRSYGIPVSGFAQGLIYNRKLFRAAGLDPDQPPTTWDQVREYAKKLSDPATGRAGFAVLSAGNQGGWQFTAWVYSFGGNLQQQRDGRWVATFTDPAAVAALDTIKAMRWEDQSLTARQLLAVKDVLPLLATEQVAMAIMAPDQLRVLKTQYQATIEDFGFGPLPQHGGNATYTGGAVWMFNPRASPEVLRAAVEWTLFRDFNLETFAADLKAQQERGQLVGWPQLPLFVGEFQQQRDAIVATYANAPVAYYQPYLAARLQLRPAPPIESQQMFALLDPVLQAVLTDPAANTEQLLADAGQQFQRQVLDPAQP